MKNVVILRSELRENYTAMKKDIHPKNYRLVVFKDMSNDHAFMSRSTINTKETIVWEDGNEYPLVKLEISNTSHPFYTGKMKLVDTAGRVDKFNSKYKKFQLINSTASTKNSRKPRKNNHRIGLLNFS